MSNDPDDSGKKPKITAQMTSPEIAETPDEDVKSTKNAEPDIIEVASVQSEEENINVRAAIVHMVGDMIQSLGVIAAALIIYFKPDWTIADPICTFLFSILVMFTTVPIFKDCMRILMENAPEDIDTVELFNALL